LFHELLFIVGLVTFCNACSQVKYDCIKTYKKQVSCTYIMLVSFCSHSDKDKLMYTCRKDKQN